MSIEELSSSALFSMESVSVDFPIFSVESGTGGTLVGLGLLNRYFGRCFCSFRGISGTSRVKVVLFSSVSCSLASSSAL
jgi:hypothetical protein